MKVVYPKHIQKGILSGMSFSIGPVTLSIIQLFIVGVGVSIALSVFNGLSRSGAKAAGIILAIIILLIAVFIAFFRISELGLLAFIAKMIRNNFFDTNKKFQVNYQKEDRLKVLIKEAQAKDQKQTVFERKNSDFSKEQSDKIDTSGLI